VNRLFAAALLSLFRPGVRAVGERVFVGTSAVEIVNGCTGLDVGIFLASAMLVFPAPWRARLRGAALAFAIAFTVNFLRVLTLCVLNEARSRRSKSCTCTSGRRSSRSYASRPSWSGSAARSERMRSLTHFARLRLAARGPFVLVVRFAVVYGLLAGLAALLPVYAQLERPLVAVANGCCTRRRRRRARSRSNARTTAALTRTSFASASSGAASSAHARARIRRVVVRRARARDAVARRTPARARRLRGAALVLAISALMLMSDVARWEEEARAAMNLPLGSRTVRGADRLRRRATPNCGGRCLADRLLGAGRDQASRTARVKIARHIARVSTRVFVFWREGW